MLNNLWVLRAASLPSRRQIAQTVARRFASTEGNQKPQAQGRQSAQAPPPNSETAPQQSKPDEETRAPRSQESHNSKVIDSLREANRFMRTYDKENFATAHSMLLGTQSYAKANNVNDPFSLGAIDVNRAYILQTNNQTEKALSLYESGLSLLEPRAVHSADPRLYGTRLMTYAELLVNSGRFHEAREIYKQAISVFKNAFKLSELSGVALCNLAALLSQQQKFKEALPYAEEALKTLKAVVGMQSDLTKNCAVNLVLLYNALGTPEKVKNLDASFNDMEEPVLQPPSTQFNAKTIDSMKEGWRKVGRRGIFDMPGLHKGRELSTASTKAFLDAWIADRGSPEPFYSDITQAEVHALDNTHEQVRKWTPKQILGPEGRTLDHKKPNYPREPFHDKPVPGVTNISEAVKDWPKRVEAMKNMTPDQYELSKEEEDAVIARTKEIHEKYATDPSLQIVEEEDDDDEETIDKDTARLLDTDPNELSPEQTERMRHLERLLKNKPKRRAEDEKIKQMDFKARNAIREYAGIPRVEQPEKERDIQDAAEERASDEQADVSSNQEENAARLQTAKDEMNEEFMATLRPHWGEKDFWDQYYRNKTS